MSCNVGFGNQIYEVTRPLPLRELVCYYWCMRFIAQLSSIRHQYLLWVQSLPRTRYRGLALVAALGRIWPPVENSPSDVSYKKAGSGRLKRSSTSATLLWNTAATGAPGPMCREQAPGSMFHLCSKQPRKRSIQVPNVFRSRSARETSSATKRNIMEQNGTHFPANRDLTKILGRLDSCRQSQRSLEHPDGQAVADPAPTGVSLRLALLARRIL